MSNPNPAEALRILVESFAEQMSRVAEALAKLPGRDAYTLAPTPADASPTAQQARADALAMMLPDIAYTDDRYIEANRRLDAYRDALMTPVSAPDVEADNEQLRARLDRVIKQRDQAAALIAAVRVLHGPATHNGRQICATCSAYDGLSCDSTLVPYSECATLAVLDGRLVPADARLTPAVEPGPACPSCGTAGAFIGKPLHRRDCPNRPTGPTLDIACTLPADGPADA